MTFGKSNSFFGSSCFFVVFRVLRATGSGTLRTRSTTKNTKIIFSCSQILFYFVFLIVSPVLSQTNKDQTKKGSTVGFTTIRKTSKDGDPLLINLWYPANGSGHKMNLKDYLIADKLYDSIDDAKPLERFIGILKRPLFDREIDISDAALKNVLSFSFKAVKDAPVKKGKFPVIIASAMPDSYTELFEFFASHGFVVAGITFNWKDAPNDSLLYHQATNVLEELLNYVCAQSFTDTANITAFGHGGGIQPAFYLAMRSPKLKAIMNLDGGVFGARSKTTLSTDYNPDNLKVPMLHIVTQSQHKMDEQKELDALSNTRYRIIIKSDSVLHHDFTSWGRIVVNPLHQRGPSTKLVNAVFSDIEDIILEFAKNKKISREAVREDLFDFDVIGKSDRF